MKRCKFYRSKFCTAVTSYFLVSLKNVSTEYLQVLDFFNTRMDAQRVDGDWSVNEVLQVIIVNCRSWRGDGMKVTLKNHDLWFALSREYIIRNLRGLHLLALFLRMLFFFDRCLLNCASHMNKRAIQRSFLSHMYGSLYYPIGMVLPAYLLVLFHFILLAHEVPTLNNQECY